MLDCGGGVSRETINLLLWNIGAKYHIHIRQMDTPEQYPDIHRTIRRYVDTYLRKSRGVLRYCKTHNICGIKFPRFSENNMLAYFKFGSHNIP